MIVLGVARAFAYCGLGAYFAGIWEASLPLGLTWHTVINPALRTFGPLPQYCAPSWSWTSSRIRVVQPKAGEFR